ncbi:MAG: hypothetical protein KC910_27860, partial [Candidatus Eremiobacteraeota bacterium]|nr:hypothetical protein [Candidatus Eremiobacteraeota bacterium]
PVARIDQGMSEYRIDLRKLSVRECWNLSPGLFGFGLLLASKLFRFNLDDGKPTASYIENLIIVPAEEFPAEVYYCLEKTLESANDLGLALAFLYSIPSPKAQGYAAVFVSPDLQFLVEVIYSRLDERVVTGNTVSSRLHPAGELITTGLKRSFDPPDGFEVDYLTDQPLEKLVARHRERMPNKPIQPLPDERKALEYHVLCRNQEFVRRMVERKIYVICEPEVEAKGDATST